MKKLSCAGALASAEPRRLRFPGDKVLVLALALNLLPLRRAAGGEDKLDFKTLIYKEDGDRMQIVAPTAALEKELTPTLTIRIEGIYNFISGASPTGAPPPGAPATSTLAAAQPAPIGISGIRPLTQHFDVLSGATTAPAPAPAPAPTRALAPAAPRSSLSSSSSRSSSSSAPSVAAPGTAKAGSTTAGSTTAVSDPAPISQPPSAPKVPTARANDQRYGLNVELIKNWGRHTAAAQVSYSEESDYWSRGLALRDAIDFNQKNTTLLVGVGANSDLIRGSDFTGTESKRTLDGMIGVTQLLDPQTFFTVNLSLGRADGYLSDPYKVVELNGRLVPENRPGEKTKQIVYLALTHYFEAADASAEVSYRYYRDSFGINAGTWTLSWHQKFGEHFILRPMLRYYQQGAADFYAVRFSGAPEFYSADYRLSQLRAMGYGLKLIWKPHPGLSFDAALERYEQQRRDGVTSPDAYPSATVVMLGCSVWL